MVHSRTGLCHTYKQTKWKRLSWPSLVYGCADSQYWISPLFSTEGRLLRSALTHWCLAFHRVSVLFVLHTTACVVHSSAHSPKAWIIILLVNYDKDFLYIHPAWKQHASTNMSLLIIHPLLWVFTIRYPLVGIWQALMFTFTSPPPPLNKLPFFHLWDTDGVSCKAQKKSSDIVFTTWNCVNKWHYQQQGDMQLSL